MYSGVDVASGPDALGIDGLIIGHSQVHFVVRCTQSMVCVCPMYRIDEEICSLEMQ